MAKHTKRRRPAEMGRVPKALYVVCSTPSNPHSNGPVEVFTSKRAAERATRWGDQRLVTFVPEKKVAKKQVKETTIGVSVCCHGTAGCSGAGDKHWCERAPKEHKADCQCTTCYGYTG